MNQQEREQLATFLQQLCAAQVGPRDGEAERMIAAAVARQPDAAYLLVQRALLQEQALRQAQAEIARLSAPPAPPAAASGNFFADNAWGQHASRAVPAPAAVATPYPAGPQASAVPGWLGQAAGTAAGVVAGAFLFQGLEHWLGGERAQSSHQGLLDQPAAPLLANADPGRDDLSGLSAGLSPDDGGWSGEAGSSDDSWL